MKPPILNELTCNRWLAKIRLQGGNEIDILIHRGSPINARDAMQAARKTARFGKVANLLPVGTCVPYVEDDEEAR